MEFMSSAISSVKGIYTPESPVVMGIVNVTPDSFYGSSRCENSHLVVDRVREMIEQGAGIIDLGGCSTRPNAAQASLDEEMSRVLPALEAIRYVFPDIVISIDTFRGEVARRCVTEYGVQIVNDVYSFDKDPSMLDVVSELKVPYILMHSFPINCVDTDFMKEIFAFFVSKIEILRQRGVDTIIVDPGFGFGKTMEQNFELLKRQSELLPLNCPILTGISRKRMIWQSLDITPDDALNGTTVLNTIALSQGASILRVHDVRAAVEAVRLHQMCCGNR